MNMIMTPMTSSEAAIEGVRPCPSWFESAGSDIQVPIPIASNPGERATPAWLVKRSTLPGQRESNANAIARAIDSSC